MFSKGKRKGSRKLQSREVVTVCDHLQLGKIRVQHDPLPAQQ